jgi:hypothetical protein
VCGSYKVTNTDVIRVHIYFIYVANLDGVSLVDGFKNPPPFPPPDDFNTTNTRQKCNLLLTTK